MIDLGRPARQADRPEDYARLGLDGRHIQQWEDGIRVDTGAPDLEWWYCDADLDDGTGLAMLFCTKDGTRPNQPLAPQATGAFEQISYKRTIHEESLERDAAHT